MRALGEFRGLEVLIEFGERGLVLPVGEFRRCLESQVRGYRRILLIHGVSSGHKAGGSLIHPTG